MRLDRVGYEPGAIYRLRDDLTAYMACSHANEVKNFPAMCGMDIDLVANNQWWDSVGTPSTAATMVDVAGESITENYEFCLKCVADATTEGLYQRFTYAAEPRIKSGQKLSAIAAVWVATADRTVTMSLTTSASTEVTATATAAAWTLLKCENLTLDGTYVDLKFTINGAGTFYIVPLGVNVGAKALILPPRSLTTRTRTYSAAVDLSGQGNPNTWEDVNVNALSSSLAAIALLTAYGYESSSSYELAVRTNGTNQSLGSMIGLSSAAPWAYNSLLITLDDNQTFEYKLNRSSGSSNLDSGGFTIYGWQEWA